MYHIIPTTSKFEIFGLTQDTKVSRKRCKICPSLNISQINIVCIEQKTKKKRDRKFYFLLILNISSWKFYNVTLLHIWAFFKDAIHLLQTFKSVQDNDDGMKRHAFGTTSPLYLYLSNSSILGV